MLHDEHPLAQGPHHRQVVADEHERHAGLGAQSAQELEDLRLHRHVQPRDDFVRDYQTRIQRDGARDADALALAARELVRIAVEELRRQVDSLEKAGGQAKRLAGIQRAPVREERLRKGGAHREARVEGRLRILEHDLHACAKGPQFGFVERSDVAPLEGDGACAGAVEPQQGARKGALARARFAHEADGLAGQHRQVDALEDLEQRRAAEDGLAAAVGQSNAQSPDFKHGRAPGPRPRSRARAARARRAGLSATQSPGGHTEAPR